MKRRPLQRTTIRISDWKRAYALLVGLGFRPSAIGDSLLLHDDLLRSGTGVLAAVTNRAVVVSTDRHASGYDRGVARRTIATLRFRHPIRDSTDEE